MVLKESPFPQREYISQRGIWDENRTQTQIVESAAASAGTTTLYTVPAKKIFWLTFFTWTVDGSTSACQLQKNASDVLIYLRGAANTTVTYNFFTPIKFVAGDTIDLYFNNQSEGATIVGMEENAD